MNKKPFIIKLTTILLISISWITGCREQQANPAIVAGNSDMGVAIAQFVREDVRPYLNRFMDADLTGIADLVTDFPSIKEKWNALKAQHNIPEDKLQRFDNAIYFQELLLQYFPANHPEVDSQKSESWQTKSKEIISYINRDYYELIKNKSTMIGSENYKLNSDPEIMRILDEMQNGNPPESLSPANIAALMAVNFEELVMTLTRTRFSPNDPLPK